MEKIILNPFREVIVLFFYILIIVAILGLILLFSNFRIYVNNIKVSTENINRRTLGENYEIIIYWNIINKIPVLKIIITKEKLEKLEKLKLKNIIKKIDFSKIKEKNINKKRIKEIKKYKPQVEFIDLYINIGTEDAALTSCIVVIIGTILGITLKQPLANSDKNKFIINPVYANKNLLKLELNCIIKIKMLHIIYIIYILKKKRRDDKNVRTSNRRAYGYSYE